ncbi:MAG: hypothetical protein LUD29_00365 [Clostridia bacterium]|nr:hypothetical protein [Clostridia bacterium]
MISFSASSVWAFLLILIFLAVSILIASALKRFIPFLRKALIPSSVLGGIILLIVSTVVYFCTDPHTYFFNLSFLQIASGTEEGSYTGIQILELITYHCLGLGFIAMGMRSSDRKFTKKRTGEVLNTGLTTVNSYLVQAILGIVITIMAVEIFNVTGLIDGAGILLCFGFGQGTGQAMNYGNNYEQNYGLAGGGNFGLTIAALGFLVACIGGVIYVNILKRRGKIKVTTKEEANTLADYEGSDEIPIVSSLDKFTVQIAIVLAIYGLSYLLMWAVCLPFGDSVKSTVFGFNFLVGVILTIPVKAVLNKLQSKKVIKKKVVNNFMMGRISGFMFDIMIVAGIAAIQLDLLADYWAVLLILAAVGGVATFFYIYFVCRVLFKEYRYEQFLGMFGMLTGTASSGMILLREVDGSYRTPASENMVFMNVPAIIFAIPMLVLASMAPQSATMCYISLAIAVAYFVILNIVMFRSKIFRKRYASLSPPEGEGGGGGELSEAAVETLPDAAEGDESS